MIRKGTMVRVRADAPAEVREEFDGALIHVVNVERGRLVFFDRRGQVRTIRREHAERAEG